MSHARKSKDFPKIYFEILDHFESSRDLITLPMLDREAFRIRRDFYRFRSQLRKEAEDGDAYGARLRDLCDNVIVGIVKKGYEPPNAALTFRMSPLSGGLALALGKDNPPLQPTSREIPGVTTGEIIDLTGLDDLLNDLD